MQIQRIGSQLPCNKQSKINKQPAFGNTKLIIVAENALDKTANEILRRGQILRFPRTITKAEISELIEFAKPIGGDGVNNHIKLVIGPMQDIEHYSTLKEHSYTINGATYINGKVDLVKLEECKTSYYPKFPAPLKKPAQVIKEYLDKLKESYNK